MALAGAELGMECKVLILRFLLVQSRSFACRRDGDVLRTRDGRPL